MLTPSMRARTMRPGTTPFGLSSMARIATVPVASSTRGETNSIVPMAPSDLPCTSAMRHADLAGLVSRKRRAHEVRIGVGDGEIDVQTIRLHDVSQQARLAAGGDEAAFGTHLAARQAGDRRANFRVRQLELGRAQRGTRGGHGRLGALEPSERRIAIAHAGELLVVKRHDAVPLAARLTEVGFFNAERSARLRDPRAKRIRIDAEQNLAGLDARALVVAALEQDARDARANLDLAHAFELRGVLERQRQLTRLDIDDADLDRRRRRRRGRLGARGEQ